MLKVSSNLSYLVLSYSYSFHTFPVVNGTSVAEHPYISLNNIVKFHTVHCEL